MSMSLGDSSRVSSESSASVVGAVDVITNPPLESASPHPITRLFSSSMSQIRQSLNSVQRNPDSRHIVMITAVLLADVCFLTITVSLPGLIFTTIVVPLAILNQNNKASPIDQINLTSEKIAVIVAAIFVDLCFLSVALSQVSLLLSTIVVPITIFRYLKDDVLDLRVIDGTGQKVFKRLTVIRRFSVGEGGGYSFVIQGRLDDGQMVALKVFKTAAEINALKKPADPPENETHVSALIDKEIKHLKRVKGIEGALQLHDRVAIVGDLHLGIVTDWAGVDLFNWQHDNDVTPEATTQIVLQLLKTFRKIHEEAELVHADVKPENFLIDAENKVTVIDFGLSHKNKSKVRSRKGNTEFLAPECLLRQEQDAKVDMWALGCTFFELIGGALGVVEKITVKKVNGVEELIYISNPYNNNSLYKEMQNFVRAIEHVIAPDLLVFVEGFKTSIEQIIKEREDAQQIQAEIELFQRSMDKIIQGDADALSIQDVSGYFWGRINQIIKNPEAFLQIQIVIDTFRRDIYKKIEESKDSLQTQAIITDFQRSIDQLVDARAGGDGDYAGDFTVITTLIKKLLCLDPQERLTSMEALKFLIIEDVKKKV